MRQSRHSAFVPANLTSSAFSEGHRVGEAIRRKDLERRVRTNQIKEGEMAKRALRKSILVKEAGELPTTDLKGKHHRTTEIDERRGDVDFRHREKCLS